MIKLLFTIQDPEMPALRQLHQVVTQELGSQDNLQLLADHILAKSRPLIQSGKLDDGKLIIKLHKVQRSKDWNLLLVKYKDYPHWYQAEIKYSPDQITLFS